MKLHVGERLSSAGPGQRLGHRPGGYLVTEVVSESPWLGVYQGRKIFHNFDFINKRLRETDANEWLDVTLRTIRYPFLDDPVYVAQRRELTRGEVRLILGQRSSNLWPEPLDLLEMPNTRDPFTFRRTGVAEESEPILVLARPQGQTLGDWQQNVLPLASILAVLAEVLDFIEAAHAGGLLLQGLGPAALLIDRNDRVHYVGTDLVVPRALVRHGAWKRLFPPERLPRGFAAPEYFQAPSMPDQPADLFAWGCLAYFLLTGQRPGDLAVEQGRAWPQFQEDHFVRLERGLREIPPAYMGSWVEQLGLGAIPLTPHWPGQVARVMRLLLHPDPARRPASVGQLRSWLLNPPPPPVAAVLPLVVQPGVVRLFLALDGTEPGLEMEVRRGVGLAPKEPGDGVLIQEGPLQPHVDDETIPLTPDPVHYTVFTRRSTEAGLARSPGVSAELLTLTAANIRRLAEDEARTHLGRETPPPRVALCLAALEPMRVVEALLASTQPAVRVWGLARLARMFQEKPEGAEAHALLWRALRDPEAALRLRAAAGLLSLPRPDEVVYHLAKVLGNGQVEEALQQLPLLRSVGLGPEQSQRVQEMLEGEQPAACPECHILLAHRDRAEHLRTVHGYVPLEGSLVPRDAALAHWWEQVIFQGAPDAHRQILDLCQEPGRNSVADRYLTSLRQEIDRHGVLFASDPEADEVAWEPLDRLVGCLRQEPRVQALGPAFLRADHPWIRALGREVLLPGLGGRLRGQGAAEVQAELTRLCPVPELLREALLLCRHLPRVGVDAETAQECEQALLEERPVACPECAAPLRQGDLETHLRRVHGIYEFQGVRGSFKETRAAVLDALCGYPPAPAVWRSLEGLAQDAYDTKADRHLVTWVCHRLKTLGHQERDSVLPLLAETLSRSAAGPRLLPLLVRPLRQAPLEPLARQLALEIVTHLPPPVPEEVLALVKPLLAQRSLPREVREQAVASLLASTGTSGPAATELLKAYVAQTGKLRAVERLRQLEERVGQAPAITELCARLEDQVRMYCPRCPTQLRRIDMVQHLWDRHNLILEGLRVREPWRALEDWILDYGMEKDSALLRRCQDLARKLNPRSGLVKLQRLLARDDIDGRDNLALLIQEAKAQKACVCPRCFALIPVAVPSWPEPLAIDEDSLEGYGYRLELGEGGFFPGMTLWAGDSLLEKGRQPGRGLTRQGAIVLVVGPVVLAAALLLDRATHSELPGWLLLLLALGLAVSLSGLVVLLWPASAGNRDAVLDAAWQRLVPLILEEGVGPEEIDLLASLARASIGEGRPRRRRDPLDEARDALEKLTRGPARSQPQTVAALAALRRLEAEDHAQAGGDLVPLLAEQVARCFTGDLPLTYAELLLNGDLASWPPSWRVRLQVLLCRRLFETGLELSDLAALGRGNPVLGQLAGLEDPERLARLRLLWDLLTTAPWQACGKAQTVFDLCDDPAATTRHLEAWPDLLLLPRRRSIVVGSRGVWFEDLCLTQDPGSVDVELAWRPGERGYELTVAGRAFWFRDNPNDLADHLERWLRFYFHEFVPRLQDIHSKGPSEAGIGARRLQAVNCPECNKPLLVCPGDKGIPVD